MRRALMVLACIVAVSGCANYTARLERREEVELLVYEYAAAWQAALLATDQLEYLKRKDSAERIESDLRVLSRRDVRRLSEIRIALARDPHADLGKPPVKCSTRETAVGSGEYRTTCR